MSLKKTLLLVRAYGHVVHGLKTITGKTPTWAPFCCPHMGFLG